MNTTADKLELLLRTKERQKAYLQEKYPLLDFDTIPFRAYLDLFQGRSYVPGFVGGWKSYGRSNADADRDVLYDYSGHGRDIRLYNFVFKGMSGYGGYLLEDYTFGINQLTTSTSTVVMKDAVRVSYVNTVGLAANTQAIFYKAEIKADVSYKITAGPYGTVVSLYKRGEIIIRPLTLAPEETGSFTISKEYITAGYSLHIGPYIDMPADAQNYVDFLPVYPGGLVSDGIDDYGQCIKNFALPDDYTVVAVRKFINFNQAALAEKSRGAFSFEYGSASTFSYGKLNYVTFPPLFSYQTKNSYNGNELIASSDSDSDDNPLVLFKTVFTSDYKSVALYDLRIYDHTLTAEELQTVKDEMMSDYEAATGGA